MTRTRFVSGWIALILVSVGFCDTGMFGANLASAQSPPRDDRSVETPTPIASTRSTDSIQAGLRASTGVLRASAKFQGTPSTGLEVTLDGTASTGGRMWYRWLQSQGPKVVIEDATKPEARFTVPPESTMLGFVLVVGNATGVDAQSLLIDVEDPERDAENHALKADAGDDQAVKTGRKVILNGVRSEPKGKLRFRWFQTSGPKVVLKTNDGPTASFVPTLSGNYQFALIVATPSGALSEPSLVSVTARGTVRTSAEAPSMAIDELARVSLSSIEGGAKYAEDLSRAFDSVADGIDRFLTFNEAITETTRRLDAVVPRDKERRMVWIEQLFSPLMAKVVEGMRVEGIDLTRPEVQAIPLTKVQKARLAEQFRYTAAGLRATKTRK